MGGVQRPAKFAKYLSRFGHDLTVIAAQPVPGEITDDTLLGDIPDHVRVIRLKPRSARSVLRALSGRGGEAGGSSRQSGRWARHLRAWSRVPDDKIGYVPSAIRAAKIAFRNSPPDIILTTAPPPSIQMIGRHLQKTWQVPWVADFRDPWFLASDDKLPTPIHRAIKTKVLRTTLEYADAVTAVSPGIVDDFKSWGALRDDIPIITNGYDEDDFATGGQTYDTLEPNRLRFHLYGTISANAPPEPFLTALSAWRKSNPEAAGKVELSHRGAIVDYDLDSLIEKYDLPKRFASLGYAPHWFAVKELANAHALILSVADRPGLHSNIPGRVYECLRSRRPILAFVPPDGAAADILRQFDGVRIIKPNDTNAAISAISDLYTHWQSSPNPQIFPRENITRYSRESLTRQLVDEFDRLTRKGNQ